MTPDYEYNGKCHIRFFNCDNMEFMKEVNDKEYAISLVDPPYGIDKDGGKIGGDNCGKAKNYTKKTWDKKPPTQEYFNKLLKIYTLKQEIKNINEEIKELL